PHLEVKSVFGAELWAKEPFEVWLHSFRDLGWKMAAAAGIVLAVAASIWVVRELVAQERRDRAFEQIKRAVAARDPDGARTATQAYLDAPEPWYGRDERRSTVEGFQRGLDGWEAPVRQAAFLEQIRAAAAKK